METAHDHEKELETCLDQETSSSSSSSSSPHEAMFFVLAYLPLYELLVMTRVCKSLRHAVENDIIPWLNIIADQPLSTRLNDDQLVEVVVSKAKGRLQSLALLNCIKITDSGILRVASQNPHISKLHVPGCTSISPKGITEAVKLLTTEKHRLESLHINGIYNIGKEDYDTLIDLIKPENQGKIFYHEHRSNSSTSRKFSDADNRAIDVEICPKCGEVRMVFDCPRVSCKKKKVDGCCKGCGFCIARCAECGVCLDSDEEREEACCEDELCLDCWLKLPKCSFCNKPYCNVHLHQRRWLEGSVGFVCSKCYSEFN